MRLSARPPADAPQHRLGKDVDVCAEKTPCAHFYRDHSNIVVPDRAAAKPAAAKKPAAPTAAAWSPQMSTAAPASRSAADAP